MPRGNDIHVIAIATPLPWRLRLSHRDSLVMRTQLRALQSLSFLSHYAWHAWCIAMLCWQHASAGKGDTVNAERKAVIDACRKVGLPYHFYSIVSTHEALCDLASYGVMESHDTNREGLTWEEWLRASGPCSVMSGRDNARRRECEYTLRAAWLAGEDPTEYRA
jgi:hypothetical protein